MATAPSKRTTQDPYLGKTVAGRYRLEARLGEGGMGIVYRARHVLIDRVVALKLIRPDLRSETHLRAWMLREARAANRVDHAHIVQIHDVGETDEGELYLVMEYLVGTALSSVCAKGPLAIERGSDIIEQMCAALARAHDLGVVHRDLKSDNIMLTAQGGRKDFVKILDFGLAALTRDARLAPKGAVFGTPEYMAPEQARGEDATALCDLYALGILYFEMLTGRLPFRSNDRETLLEMQRTSPAPSPRSLRAEIPPQAEAIIMRLLEKDRHHLQEQLKAFIRSLPSRPLEISQTDTPIAPPPPPPAPTPGVQEWGTRAANFQRIVARAYPNGQTPDDVGRATEDLWLLASRASRLEGELASLSRKLEATERRGRALRAEIGRKVEELAAEESRALRETNSMQKSAEKADRKVQDAKGQLQAAEQRASAVSQTQDLATTRQAFEAVGAARALVGAYRVEREEHMTRARDKQQQAEDLRRQIEDLRKQLQRYSDALENDLATGRERIASRVKEALSFEENFGKASALLIAHLNDNPDCRDLLKELTETDQRGLHERRRRSRNSGGG